MSVLPPAPPAIRSKRQRFLLIFIAALLVTAVVVAAVVWFKFFRHVPREFDSPEEYFKYGSIGTEDERGVPYWIWVVLPRVFPEHLPDPGGYTAIGITWEDGREMPVGFTKEKIGFDRVGINCALCHTATYRETAVSDTVVVPGGPATSFDPQGYLRFLSLSARDSRFNADTLLAAIEYEIKLSWLDRQLYRYFIIPATRKALLEQADSDRWMTERPAWGHGRIDPFNPVKFDQLAMNSDRDATVGNSDVMPLWRLDDRRSSRGETHLHWDGLNTDLREVVLSGAIGDGATHDSLPVERLDELTAWLRKHQPDDLLEYPFQIDPALAAEGATIFEKHCAECHGQGGARTNTVVALSAIGTDGNRLAMWNPPPDDPPHPAERYNAFADGYDWDLKRFRKTDGYVATPLTAIWLRAPYLHNGSVPTLWDLLHPSLPPPEAEALVDTIGDAALGRNDVADRLHTLLDKAGAPTQAPERVRTELDALKPLVDQVVETARSRGYRPPLFYRGSNILTTRSFDDDSSSEQQDERRLVGFVHTSDGLDDRRLAVPYATFVRGNGNRGHEGSRYGTDLNDQQRRALVEYLKTL
ncbi:MAG: hypothetical protein WBC44_21160 [Planctomycetaceae bacterium]